MAKKTSKKKYFLLFSVGISLLMAEGVHLLLNNRDFRDKARNFSYTSDPIPERRVKKPCCQKINREGLDTLNAYGSGFINYKDFGAQVNHDYKNLYVISLLPTDIYYYKGRCLSWYGLGYTPDAVGQPHDPMAGGFSKRLLRYIYGSPPTHDIAQLDTEDSIVKSLGAHYLMPLKNNEDWLTDYAYIDDLVSFFQTIPPGKKLYFHCSHGCGRTTTFMVFYDIFRNGKKVPLKEIVNRHYCLGREDLFNTTVRSRGSWTPEGLQARKALIENFYTYMTSPDGYPNLSWTQWTKMRGIVAQKINIHRSV